MKDEELSQHDLTIRYIPLAISLGNSWRRKTGILRGNPIYDDLMGASFLGLCQAASTWQHSGPFSAFARPRIAGEILNELHRERRHWHGTVLYIIQSYEELNYEENPAVWEAFRSLSDRDQHMISRYVFYEEPYTWTAADMGITDRAVSRGTAKALNRMRDRLNALRIGGHA